METGDSPQISHLSNSKPNTSDTKQNLQKILFSVYKNHQIKFVEWMRNKKVTEAYIRDLTRVLENTLKLKFDNVIELRDRLATVKNRKYRALALRNLFNFCEEYELLDSNLIYKLKARIKVSERSNIDSYIPNDDTIREFLELIKDYNSSAYLFVKILIESGLRIAEVEQFIRTVDMNKFEVSNDVAVYPLYHLRGTKSSYYVFMSYDTYRDIVDNVENLKSFNVQSLKTWIKRKESVPLKYLRKYNFTKLVKAGVSFEIANFIQGRVSQNIGFNHYLAKKEIAIKEYQNLSIE